MNIQSFSMPEAAYFVPTVYGDFTGINRRVWILSHVLAEQKFMAIFSMLYGAKLLLLPVAAPQANASLFGEHSAIEPKEPAKRY